MIDFDLTEEQRALREVSRNLLQKECPMTLVRKTMATKEGLSRDLWSKIAEAGWLGLIIPSDFSGAEMTCVEVAIILDEMERVAFQGPYIETAVLAPTLITLTGTSEQKKRFLPKISKGELIISSGLKEGILNGRVTGESSPSSLVAVSSSNDRYLVSGSVPLVGFARQSDYILVPIQSEEEGLLYAFINSSSKRIRFSEDAPLDPTLRLGRVTFEKVEVPHEDIFRAKDPLGLLDHLISLGAICVASASVGGASRVLDMTLEYSKSRVQFGVPIGSFQAIKHKCADMFSLLSGAEASAYYSAWCYSHHTKDVQVQASIAKICCTKMYSKVTGHGIQIHGGIGFAWDHDLHIFLKRAKRYEFSFGSSSWHINRLAEHIIDGAPMEAFHSSETEEIAPSLVRESSR